MISLVNVVDAFAKDIIKRKAFNYVLQTQRKKCPNAEIFSGPNFCISVFGNFSALERLTHSPF